MGSYTDGFLKRLRNEIDIDQMIHTLALETRTGTKLPPVSLSGLPRISHGDQPKNQPG